MIQTYAPNLGVSATRGWCLKYVDDAGSAPSRTATARYSWQVERDAGRIKTTTIPENVWVVGWLDFTSGMYTTYGHVFFVKRNGASFQIYDSEVAAGARKPYGHLNELLAWFGAYSPIYLGWSTDCDGRNYANKGEDMAEKANLDTARILSDDLLGRDGYDGRLNAHAGQTDGGLVGLELTNANIRKLWLGKEAAAHRDIRAAVYKERDALRAKLAAIKPGEAEAKLQAIKDALK